MGPLLLLLLLEPRNLFQLRPMIVIGWLGRHLNLVMDENAAGLTPRLLVLLRIVVAAPVLCPIGLATVQVVEETLVHETRRRPGRLQKLYWLLLFPSTQQVILLLLNCRFRGAPNAARVLLVVTSSGASTHCE